MDIAERLIALVDKLVQDDAELPCVEFKVNNCDPERIGTLISAISNSACLRDEPYGYVVWGVNDEKHEIIGTTFRPVTEKAHGQPIELWLASNINPSLHFAFKEVPHPRGRVVLLEIPCATAVSVKFKNIAYIRIGPTTPKLADHPAFEASLNAKLQTFAWEQGIAAPFVATKDVLQLLNVGAYFNLTQQAVPGSDEAIAQVLAHDKLIQRDVGGRWNILNLGAVLFATDIRRFSSIARKTVRLFWYGGTTRSETETPLEESGTRGYAVGFEPLIEHISKRLPKKDVISKALRVPQPIFPRIAERELVANALLIRI
jgi:ATP-dependent DNA helicase RecG